MTGHRGMRGLFLLLLLAALGGCALLRPPESTQQAAAPNFWSGRLAVQTGDEFAAREEVKAFSAAFDLQGDVQQGELNLYSPLGNTALRAQWDEAGAVLTDDKGRQQRFASLELLLLEAAGVPVPPAALFGWLHGDVSESGEAAGWRVDLEQFRERGRITAWRDQPQPPVRLRIVLE